jgi:hypothetical protein
VVTGDNMHCIDQQIQVCVHLNPNEPVMYVDGAISFNVPDPPATSSIGATGTGVTGAANTSDIGSGAGQTPSGAGFYVAPTGSDRNPGTLAAPFATLQRAQEAMEDSSIKTTYVEGGTYHLTGTLQLTAADNGETWQYYPPNGVDSAILDAGGTGVPGSNTGLVNVITLEGVSNITINGLKIQDFDESAIYTPAPFARSNHVTIENMDIGHDSHGSKWGQGAIWLDNVTNATIANNYVHDVHWDGIMLSAYNAGESIDGGLVEGNVVTNTLNNPTSADGAAIYVSMFGIGLSGGSVTIKNNFVRDYAVYSDDARGIYLDDYSSHVTVTGNVIGAPGNNSRENNVEAIVVHNGADNTITNNIIDLGSVGNVWTIWYAYDANKFGVGMVGNIFADNIIISRFAGNQTTNYGGSSGYSFLYWNNTQPGSGFSIHDNLYYNYGGGQVRTDGRLASDSHPITGRKPNLSGYLYRLAGSGPAVPGDRTFSPIVGGWGPPGFVIPKGTAASHQ